ncbi:hypothetical protein LEN26_016210 [Aphanomyces euteiches]|nr:hypothetical protein LEN26_016210 [Aphanomyces euteiches]KAH9196742.1 hypothetical protein AeNC1_001263 [Aphanomyces euteiches]
MQQDQDTSDKLGIQKPVSAQRETSPLIESGFSLSKEDKVLTELDPRFFTQDFDPVQYVLDNLPTNPFKMSDHLQAEIGAMDVAKDIVTSKLAEDIQRNYTTFIQGMNQVQEVDFDLALALIQVKNGRRLLASHKKDLVMSHLELVKLRRNRDRLQTIVDHASNILSCFKQEQDMFTLLQDHDYKRAVDVCIDMKDRYSDLRQFVVLRPILHRMARALPELRKHFDSSLRSLLVAFDAGHYAKLIEAYAALDKQVASSSSQKSYVPVMADVVVRGMDELAREILVALDESTKAAAPSSISSMMDTVLTAYENAAQLLYSYHLMAQWHASPSRPQVDGVDEELLNQLEQNLLKHRSLVWESLQQRMGDMWNRLAWPNDVQMEHVVGLSHATKTFLALGDEFSGAASSNKLRTVWLTKCRVFLSQMQHDSIELMRMMLDTEKWERLSIAIDDSRGILWLLEQRSGYVLTKPDHAVLPNNLLAQFTDGGNPFSPSQRKRFLDVPAMERYTFVDARKDEEDRLIERMLEMDPYLKDPSMDVSPIVDPSAEEIIRFGSKHVVTSSAFSGFLRFCGIYVKLMQQVPLLSDDAWTHLLGLFEFVFYATFCVFCPAANVTRLLARQTPTDLPSDNLRVWILKLQQLYPIAPVQGQGSPGFLELVVAFEALVFQMHVLLTAANAMSTSLDPIRIAMDEARTYVYASVTPASIQASAIPAMIEKASWDVNDMSDKHNEYVVTVVRNCGIFWGSLQGSSVPPEVRDELWGFVVRAIMEALVDGFASVKKCSMEGRALMSMDLIALQNGLDLINHVSNQSQTTMWGRSYVHNFVKAYYYQEPELLAFIAANKNRYRKVHLVSLATNGVCSSLRKPAFKDLMHQIDQIFRTDK